MEGKEDGTVRIVAVASSSLCVSLSGKEFAAKFRQMTVTVTANGKIYLRGIFRIRKKEEAEEKCTRRPAKKCGASGAFFIPASA